MYTNLLPTEMSYIVEPQTSMVLSKYRLYILLRIHPAMTCVIDIIQFDSKPGKINTYSPIVLTLKKSI